MMQNGAHAVLEPDQHHAAEAAGAPRELPQQTTPADVYRAALRVMRTLAAGALFDQARAWVTLFAVFAAWGYALHTLANKPSLPWWPLVIAASLFSVVVHVPIRNLWRR